MAAIEYHVTGMTCGHCERAVRQEVARIDGVHDVQVSAQNGKLVVNAATVDDDAVLAAVAEAGYSAARIR